MWFSKKFKGDTTGAVHEMQFDMYSYASSTIFEEVSKLYLCNQYVNLYIPESILKIYKDIKQWDHRIIQKSHDSWAAVFRYQFLHGSYKKTLFEDSEKEIIDYHSCYYKDVLFLEKIDKELWYLTKEWRIFLENEVQTNYSITREIAESVLVNNTFIENSDRNKRWAAADNSSKMIKLKYSHIPWNYV